MNSPIIVRAYSLHEDANTSLRKNFKLKEFACKDGTDTVIIADELLDVLQTIRDHFNRGVHINSQYRTEAHNAKIGGAQYSKHKRGWAADIVISGVSPVEVAKYAETILKSHGGIGVYGTFTHIDVRPNRYRFDQRSGKPVSVSGWY